jgi:hypothetical protein
MRLQARLNYDRILVRSMVIAGSVMILIVLCLLVGSSFGEELPKKPFICHGKAVSVMQYNIKIQGKTILEKMNPPMGKIYWTGKYDLSNRVLFVFSRLEGMTATPGYILDVGKTSNKLTPLKDCWQGIDRVESQDDNGIVVFCKSDETPGLIRVVYQCETITSEVIPDKVIESTFPGATAVKGIYLAVERCHAGGWGYEPEARDFKLLAKSGLNVAWGKLLKTNSKQRLVAYQKSDGRLFVGPFSSSDEAAAAAKKADAALEGSCTSILWLWIDDNGFVQRTETRKP